MKFSEDELNELAPREFNGSEPEPAYPELSPAALHGLAGDIVRAILPHTESDLVALLIQTLCAFGSTIGRNAYYQVEAVRHYPNLYTILVGKTSKARKGTSREQIMHVFRSVDDRWESECLQSGLSSGEGLIWAVRDRIEKQEAIKEKNGSVRYQTVIVDTGIEDKRLLVDEPEFASVLRVVEREGNTLSAVIRAAWDSGRLRTLTKNSPARATDAHISIIGHITQEELCRYLNSTEAANGFANRFLWMFVRRSKCLPEGGHIQDVDFGAIAKRLQECVDFGRKAARVTWDSKGRLIWHEVYPNLSEGKPGLLGAVTSRAEAQVVRLALIYALLDISEHIGENHLLAALALWDYAEHSARYIFGEALGDPVADEILRVLRGRYPNGMTRTDINNLFGGHRLTTDITQALTTLLKQRLVRSQTQQTSGRKAELWYAEKAD